MKTKITRTQVKWMGKQVVNFGYCYLSNLIGRLYPDYYNTGVYGWNWDAYSLQDYLLVDGYRSFPAGASLDKEQYNALKKGIKHYDELKHPKPFHIYLNDLFNKIFNVKK